MIFETHAHYDDAAFDADREELLASLPEHGIGRVINVCASVESLDRIGAMLDRWPHVYGAVGVHPDEVGGMNEAVMEKIRMLCRHEKVLAVGEIGLDYHWNVESHETQGEWFKRQLELAREEGLPVSIHSREAAADTLKIAKEMDLGGIGGVLHCYSYSKELAKEYLDMGMYLGIGGVVTFKNAKRLKEVVAYAPLDRLLLETDCPYMAPEPYRGKRNSSLYLSYVANRIGQLKGVSPEEVIRVTEENAKRLFLHL